MPDTWRSFHQFVCSEALVKDECEEEGARFEGLTGLGRAGARFVDQILIKGELLERFRQGRPQQGDARAADCIFYLLESDGCVRLAVVELKGGVNISVGQFKEKLQTSTRLAMDLASTADLPYSPMPYWATPRLAKGSAMDRYREQFTAEYPYFRVQRELAKLIATVDTALARRAERDAAQQ